MAEIFAGLVYFNYCLCRDCKGVSILNSIRWKIGSSTKGSFHTSLLHIAVTYIYFWFFPSFQDVRGMVLRTLFWYECWLQSNIKGIFAVCSYLRMGYANYDVHICITKEGRRHSVPTKNIVILDMYGALSKPPTFSRRNWFKRIEQKEKQRL